MNRRLLCAILVLVTAIFGVSCRRRVPAPLAVPQEHRHVAPHKENPAPALRKTPEKLPGQPQPRVSLPLVRNRPARIAILIDDFGYDDETAKAFLNVPFPIAIAILPRLRYSGSISKAAKKAGKPVLLHLPLEALRYNEQLGPGALFTSMDDRDLEQTFTLDLATVPDAHGINNHMGSKGSQDPRMAQFIAKEAREHHLYLIDSLTAPNSILYDEARKFGVPAEKREIFLDNIVNEKAISSEFDELLRVAHRKGKALAIGHPHPETLKVLLERIPKLDPDKIEIVPVTELLR